MDILRESENSPKQNGTELSGRRAFLVRTLGVTAGLVGATAATGVLATPASAKSAGIQATQTSWAFCSKCFVMHFWGYKPNYGVCPSGGGHTAQGYNFNLPHSLPETSTAQANWRFCQKCFSMFFWGYPTDGVCPAGGPHSAQGFNFTLPHDVPADLHSQNNWRFCQKCFSMFFWGYPTDGVCKAGGAHSAQGFNFVLPHL